MEHRPFRLLSIYENMDYFQIMLFIVTWSELLWCYNNEQTTKQTKAINNSYIYIYHVNVTQTVPDISPLMPMHQDPLLVEIVTQRTS